MDWAERAQGHPETRGLWQWDRGHPRGVLGVSQGVRGSHSRAGAMVLLRGNESHREREVDTHICDDGHPEVGHVGDDLAVLCWDLSVLDQLVQVLLGDTWKCNGERASS